MSTYRTNSPSCNVPTILQVSSVLLETLRNILNAIHCGHHCHTTVYAYVNHDTSALSAQPLFEFEVTADDGVEHPYAKRCIDMSY